ncbi:hypothetical protein C0Z19_14345 [Trinickia soli]|uniref:Uncharacterized protein n=1 Tax=Trinickia soli TaxID=380675 RepID=A0A2N7W3P7_9BURK|nr:hypothetical protein C0Z19_14345 [Trinickia soli]
MAREHLKSRLFWRLFAFWTGDCIAFKQSDYSICVMLRDASFRSFQARLDSRNPLNGQAVSRKVE